MKSHSFELSAREWMALLGPPLLPLALFAGAMHLGALSGLLPPPRPALDTDRTILVHQAEASRSPHSATVLLLGDSSCLMDVSAPDLGKLLPGTPAVLNLGTLSYLDLRAFAAMLRQYAAANPGRLTTLVLLMHPEALRRPAPVEYHVQALQRFYEGDDDCSPDFPRVLCALGVEIFRGRLLSRTVPQPLSGSYGQWYGFTHDLWNWLSAHQGSALDPGRFEPGRHSGNAEYRLSKSLESASGDFRAGVPDGVQLVVGITPVPESVAGPAHEPRQREMLQDWSTWLQADATLADLPARWPNNLFASQTHLNAQGVRRYTEELARALAPHVRAPR